MNINWQSIAVAVASKVQYELACGRGRLLTEQVTRLALAEVIQSQVIGKLLPEYNHPDLAGNKQLDLAVMSPRDRKISVAIELKWVRKTTDNTTRPWMEEIFGDVLRLERLSVDLKTKAERAVVVVGEVDVLNSKAWDRKINPGKKQNRARVIGNLVPGKSQFKNDEEEISPTLVDLKKEGAIYQNFIRNAVPDIFNELPISYIINMSAYHRTMQDGIECIVLTVSRPVGRRNTFSGTKLWGTQDKTNSREDA